MTRKQWHVIVHQYKRNRRQQLATYDRATGTGGAARPGMHAIAAHELAKQLRTTR